MANLVTLSGTYSPQDVFTCGGCEYVPGRRSRRDPRNQTEELMGGWLTDLTHKSPVSYLWRPSKTRIWMAEVGGITLSIAPFTGPFMPIVLGVGGVFTAGGLAGKAIYSEGVKRSQKRAAIKYNTAVVEQSAKTNKMLWYGVGAVGVVGLFLVLK